MDPCHAGSLTPTPRALDNHEPGKAQSRLSPSRCGTSDMRSQTARGCQAGAGGRTGTIGPWRTRSPFDEPGIFHSSCQSRHDGRWFLPSVGTAACWDCLPAPFQGWTGEMTAGSSTIDAQALRLSALHSTEAGLMHRVPGMAVVRRTLDTVIKASPSFHSTVEALVSKKPGSSGQFLRHPSHHQPCGAEGNAVQPCNRLFSSCN